MNKITPAPPSPQLLGTTIVWTASATDPDSDLLQYKFLLRGPSTGGYWVAQTGWTPNNIFTWPTAGIPSGGAYQIEVQARDGRHVGPESYDCSIVSDFELGAPNMTEQPLDVPQLLSPNEGALLDNGRTDRSDSIIWDFKWEDVPGATKYHLYVKGEDATIPVIDVDTIESSYHHLSQSSYIVDGNLLNWSWKVKAYANGQWHDYSKERHFNVEPVNTD